MKLIFDCTSLAKWDGHPTGIQRVIIELGKNIKSIEAWVFLGLFDPSGACAAYDILNRKRKDIIPVVPGDIILTAGANWDEPEHHSCLLKLQSEGCKIITLFYDIIPMVLPHSFGPGFKETYEKWFVEALDSSSLAFAVSGNTKRDICSFSISRGLKYPEIYTVRLGDEIPVATGSISKRIKQIASSEFILSVGTIEYRKNHVLLLNAYRYLLYIQNYDPPDLIIVGRQGWLDQNIKHQIANDTLLSNKIIILNDVSDTELSHLYQRCLFTVFPSLYEGWGLPVAESLSFGKPCIISDTSSMLEIAPGIVRHVSPYNVIKWCNEIRSLSEYPENLNKAIESIWASYQRTSWLTTVGRILEVIKLRFPEINL